MSDPNLRWQCRRGMRELDMLLERYLENRYGSADEAEKTAFREVLALPDPDLNAYLLHRARPESTAIAAVIARILDNPDA